MKSLREYMNDRNEDLTYFKNYVKPIFGKKQINESIMSPLDKINKSIINGIYSGSPKISSKETQKQFRQEIRELYNHDTSDINVRNIFNKAWKNGKNDWSTLAIEYDRITNEEAPHTVLNFDNIFEDTISIVNEHMKSNEFLQFEKPVRHKLITSYIKNKVNERTLHNDYKKELIELIIEYYEDLYKCNLSQYLVEDEIEDITIEPEEIVAFKQPEIPSDKIISIELSLLEKILSHTKDKIKTENELQRLITNFSQDNIDGKIFTIDEFNDLTNDLNISEIEYLRKLSGLKS